MISWLISRLFGLPQLSKTLSIEKKEFRYSGFVNGIPFGFQVASPEKYVEEIERLFEQARRYPPQYRAFEPTVIEIINAQTLTHFSNNSISNRSIPTQQLPLPFKWYEFSCRNRLGIV